MNKPCDVRVKIRNLSCTKKSCDEIHGSHTGLTPRERQLLILIAAETHFCESNGTDNELYCKACENLLNKVDLDSLVERGYLSPKDDDTILVTGIKPIVNMDAMTDAIAIEATPFKQVREPQETEPEEVLRFLAGDF